MTLTDEEITILYSKDYLAFARAVITAHDERLRHQEPVGYVKYLIGELPKFAPVVAGTCVVDNYLNGWEPLYAAPIPARPEGEKK